MLVKLPLRALTITYHNLQYIKEHTSPSITQHIDDLEASMLYYGKFNGHVTSMEALATLNEEDNKG